MLGRRQLRAKAMQSLYAYYRGNEEVAAIERNMVKGINDIQILYYYLLQLIPAIQNEAEKKIEIGLNKIVPTQEDLNPNRKFINNSIFKIIKVNPTLIDFSEQHKELNWTVEDVYPRKIFKALQETEKYQNYMAREEDNKFNKDKSLLIYTYEHLIAPNQELSAYLEDINLNWADDMHIANTMVLNTLKSFTPKSDQYTQLFKLLLDQQHLTFTRDLLKETIRRENETSKIIEEMAINWDIERIALIDRLILQMALTEFLFFPSIPPKVTINEYVEMAKDFSTPNSKTFINGVLDKSLNVLQENGKIKKSARGMM